VSNAYRSSYVVVLVRSLVTGEVFLHLLFFDGASFGIDEFELL
jgi:hypothetical protein